MWGRIHPIIMLLLFFKKCAMGVFFFLTGKENHISLIKETKLNFISKKSTFLYKIGCKDLFPDLEYMK